MNVNRSSQLSAIILRIGAFGETHAFVDLLTPSDGLVPAVAYGLRSQRSALKGRIVPFARGTAWLYRDPRQDRSKITDFDVAHYALSLQHNLAAFYHASLWAEVVWRTHASGDAGEEVYPLIAGGLDVIESAIGSTGATRRAEDAAVRSIGFAVLWRYLDILGTRPDLDHCIASEEPIGPRDVRYYRRGDGGVVSSEWAGPAMIPVDGVAADILNALDLRTLAHLRDAAYANPEDALRAIERVRPFVLSAVQDSVETPLNTIAVGGGLL
jgi:DNA repair protein RecO (recombination protein O)